MHTTRGAISYFFLNFGIIWYNFHFFYCTNTPSPYFIFFFSLNIFFLIHRKKTLTPSWNFLFFHCPTNVFTHNLFHHSPFSSSFFHSLKNLHVFFSLLRIFSFKLVVIIYFLLVLLPCIILTGFDIN